MKEATGELNMTVIAVVAIVAVGAIFTIFILPAIRNSIRLSTACNSSNGGTQVYTDGDVNCQGNGTCCVGDSCKTCEVKDQAN